MLVVHVLGDCPSCGAKNSYGNSSVRPTFLWRGCQSCKHNEKIPLPKITKKIIYLDQYFFSSAFKENDERFLEVATKVERLKHLQLLIAPYSSIHEDETHQWSGYAGNTPEALMEFIKRASGGHEFEASFNVEEYQLCSAFESFMAGESTEFDLDSTRVLQDDIDVWDDYIFIDVGGYLGDIDRVRDCKQQAVQGLVDYFDNWQQSTSTFEEDVEAELRSFGDGYFEAYVDYIKRMTSMNPLAHLEAPVASHYVQALLRYFDGAVGNKDRIAKIREFFASEHFSNIPSNWISARLGALLKDRVKNGAFANRDRAVKRLSGFFYDVNHISLYAPYCDAFVMDNTMAEIVSDKRLALTENFGVNVYSLNNWDELHTWLDTLEAEMTEEHRQAVELAYGR